MRCKLCGCRYTPEPKDHGYDEEVRLQALTLHLEGVSLREIGRLLEVNHQSVANWIKDYENYLPPGPASEHPGNGRTGRLLLFPPHKRRTAGQNLNLLRHSSSCRAQHHGIRQIVDCAYPPPL